MRTPSHAHIHSQYAGIHLSARAMRHVALSVHIGPCGEFGETVPSATRSSQIAMHTTQIFIHTTIAYPHSHRPPRTHAHSTHTPPSAGCSRVVHSCITLLYSTTPHAPTETRGRQLLGALLSTPDPHDPIHTQFAPNSHPIHTQFTPNSPQVLLAFFRREAREALIGAVDRALAALGLSPLPPPPETRLAEVRRVVKECLV